MRTFWHIGILARLSTSTQRVSQNRKHLYVYRLYRSWSFPSSARLCVSVYICSRSFNERHFYRIDEKRVPDRLI